MKKNKMLRLASVLMVCVLLTTSVISGTFAKYVSKASVQDSARVAKWGVEVTNTGDGVFAESYESDLTTKAQTASGDEITNSVESTVKVVAPGTKGSLVNSDITGTPEVAVNVKAAATLTLTNWQIPTTEGGNEVYCPIVITVDGKPYKMGASASTGAGDSDPNVYTTIAALEAAVEEALTDVDGVNYAPGDTLDGTSAHDHNVTWEWVFEGETTDGAYRTDAKDTALGNVAATTVEDSTPDNEPTIKLDYSVTVTQID